MKSFPIPVMAIGPGSQPEEATPEYLPMPSDMAVFRPPSPPGEADPQALREVRAVLGRLIEAMRTPPAGGPRLDLGGMELAALELLNQTLGEGEVSAIVHAPRHLRIQETAFAGVWRVRELREDGSLAADRLEACPMPAAVAASVQLAGLKSLVLPPAPPGLMNSPALLAEIVDHAWRYGAGGPAHVINLTLLPVSPQDLEYMARSLGTGPATILSRGYGNCRISSTDLAHVWWVQYFNSMDKLILDTIEVVDVPEVALAAQLDYEDSLSRLGEWLEILAE